MRRLNSFATRLGTSLLWTVNSKVKNYFLISRLSSRLDTVLFCRLNNLRRTNLRRYLKKPRFLLRTFKKSDCRFERMFGKFRVAAFRKNSTARIVSISSDLRRRTLCVGSIFFLRRRMSPFWRYSRWFRKFQLRRLRNKHRYLSEKKRIQFLRRMSLNRRKFDSLCVLRSHYFGHVIRKVFSDFSGPLNPVFFCVRNSQNIFFFNKLEARNFYQSPVFLNLSRRNFFWFHAFPFTMGVLSSAFRWRNALLIVSSIGFEMRRTDFHYRFIRLFGRFIGFFLHTRYAFTNLYIRVRGCFGRVDRTRVFYVRPFFKQSTSMHYQTVDVPVKFSFCHVLTYRGVFGMALWLS